MSTTPLYSTETGWLRVFPNSVGRGEPAVTVEFHYMTDVDRLRDAAYDSCAARRATRCCCGVFVKADSARSATAQPQSKRPG